MGDKKAAESTPNAHARVGVHVLISFIISERLRRSEQRQRRPSARRGAKLRRPKLRRQSTDGRKRRLLRPKNTHARCWRQLMQQKKLPSRLT